jgi:hypothetical protein
MEASGLEILPGDDDHAVAADGPHQLILGVRARNRAAGQCCSEDKPSASSEGVTTIH